jgi:CYTH domain-containing protein
MIELEKNYLIKNIPPELKNCKFKEVLDIYIPKEVPHPVLRIRKNGESFEMTKKQPFGPDLSQQTEDTIILSEAEFATLQKLPGKRVRKNRYYFSYRGRMLEIGVFQDDLLGLVLVDVEFVSKQEMDAFKMPDFCLADVSQVDFLAGGMLCGKSYNDIEPRLKPFGYIKQKIE